MRAALMPTFAPATEMVVVRGKGPFLYTQTGQKYLDFVSGVAVNCFGHAHPGLTQVLHEQAQTLWHSSNMFRVPQAERLAKRLVKHSFGDRVFFANTGAEAIETAIKAARLYHFESNNQRQRIITFSNAFHGRTLATIAAGQNPAHMQGFMRGDFGFDQIPFEDIHALQAAVSEHTCAILLEPIQGEGGVRVFSKQFLRAVRALCDATGVLLIFDEIQCGIGRSGKLFAYQTTGVAPDIMAIAKGLGGGFPISACITREPIGVKMGLGSHGSTFGGNPLACAVANKVLDLVLAEQLLTGVLRHGEYFQTQLSGLATAHPAIFGASSGKGLMIGLTCNIPNTDVINCARANGLLIGISGNNQVRLLPPLNIEKIHIDTAIAILYSVAIQLESTGV